MMNGMLDDGLSDRWWTKW